ncbi:sugar-transfer associated ATP-grasp domain-containing protein [Taklimakanibacter deserti]|uniref:sugar-transfer associated ATP-grasp domain-containing protein n=1 Tax=Taklimakanibacter deserti TaxID=2267839 RepID=UPI0013C4CE6B
MDVPPLQHEASRPLAKPSVSGLTASAALLRGKLWKSTLARAEQFAYDVSGLPMALAPASRQGSEAAAYLHATYKEYFWRLPAGPGKALLAAVTWPFALAFTIVQNTARNGAVIRRRTGKRAVSQALGQLHCAWSYAIAPPWYYMFELFDDDRRARAPLYLTAHETIAAAYELLEPMANTDFLADKVWFADYCKTTGLIAVPVLFHAARGKICFPQGDGEALPDSDLFVKPRQGNGGHHSERWDFVGDGRYRNSKGEALRRPDLLRWIAQQSLGQDFVVQPRLVNHPLLKDISNDALATVRVLTCRDEKGGFEATNAAFRMAIGANSVVDNFHQGGLAAPVDLATGRIGLASDMGVRPHVGWRDTHPVTGIAFIGRTLPFWADVLELARRAHAAFPQRTAIGWDVAMLEDGPCIIEGNGKPDLDIHQRVERRPLGDQRIAELLAFNLRKRLTQPGVIFTTGA